ncbi:MAG: flagellar hook-associated protein FlgL, partial [Halieaceae bacterium]|nr:flagellar hook-associated protein FlgL [Halieaceae bacterium]
MVERLSTLQTFQLGIATILDKQADLQRTQLELANGKKILSPADDPSAAVKVLDIEEDLARVDQFGRNAVIARGQLAQAETALSQIGVVLQRVRELAIQANNATQSPETRNAIAVELSERLDELVGIANTRDANDEFVFAGFQARSQPFTRSGNAVTYNGDDGQRFLDI